MSGAHTFRIQKDWSDADIATLTRLWAEGHSTAEIGRRMGYIGKNAVIGKAHRLNLPARLSPKLFGKNAKTKTFWDAERDATLRRLAGTSMSLSEMGREFGVARETVRSRMCFLNIARNAPSKRASAPKVVAVKRQPEPVVVPAIVVVPGPVPTVIAVQVPRPAPVTKQYFGRVTDCTFPLSEGRPWRFCEAATLPGRSMCAHHHALSYVVSPAREVA